MKKKEKENSSNSLSNMIYRNKTWAILMLRLPAAVCLIYLASKIYHGKIFMNSLIMGGLIRFGLNSTAALAAMAILAAVGAVSVYILKDFYDYDGIASIYRAFCHALKKTETNAGRQAKR